MGRAIAAVSARIVSAPGAPQWPRAPYLIARKQLRSRAGCRYRNPAPQEPAAAGGAGPAGGPLAAVGARVVGAAGARALRDGPAPLRPAQAAVRLDRSRPGPTCSAVMMLPATAHQQGVGDAAADCACCALICTGARRRLGGAMTGWVSCLERWGLFAVMRARCATAARRCGLRMRLCNWTGASSGSLP